MTWSFQRENGCVPAAATRRPTRSAPCDSSRRVWQISLDLIAERGAALGQQLRDVRAQFPRVGIDDLEFLLDADRERVPHGSDHSATRWYPLQAPECLPSEALLSRAVRARLTSPSSV